MRCPLIDSITSHRIVGRAGTMSGPPMHPCAPTASRRLSPLLALRRYFSPDSGSAMPPKRHALSSFLSPRQRPLLFHGHQFFAIS
jgi:hypothetical protein